MATQAFDDNGSRWLQILHSKNCLLLTFTPGMPVTKGRPLGDVRDRLILIFATIGKLVFFGTRPTEGGNPAHAYGDRRANRLKATDAHTSYDDTPLLPRKNLEDA